LSDLRVGPRGERGDGDKEEGEEGEDEREDERVPSFFAIRYSAKVGSKFPER
jgi:hypothetical protein